MTDLSSGGGVVHSQDRWGFSSERPLGRSVGLSWGFPGSTPLENFEGLRTAQKAAAWDKPDEALTPAERSYVYSGRPQLVETTNPVSYEGYENRRPTVYVKSHNTVYVGRPGHHHQTVLDEAGIPWDWEDKDLGYGAINLENGIHSHWAGLRYPAAASGLIEQFIQDNHPDTRGELLIDKFAAGYEDGDSAQISDPFTRPGINGPAPISVCKHCGGPMGLTAGDFCYNCLGQKGPFGTGTQTDSIQFGNDTAYLAATQYPLPNGAAPWSPGQHGRGLLGPNGEFHAWTNDYDYIDEHPEEFEDLDLDEWHHGDMAEWLTRRGHNWADPWNSDSRRIYIDPDNHAQGEFNEAQKQALQAHGIEPRANGWTFGKTASEMAWKWVALPDGQVYALQTPTYEEDRHNWKSHDDVWEEAPFDYTPELAQNWSGGVMLPNGAVETWYGTPSDKTVEGLKRYVPNAHHAPTNEGTKFGHREDLHGWTPGNEGKGFLLHDNTPVTWNLDPYGALEGEPEQWAPHHTDMAYRMGLRDEPVNEHDSVEGEWHSPVYINTAGEVFPMNYWGSEGSNLNLEPFEQVGLSPSDPQENWKFASYSYPYGTKPWEPGLKGRILLGPYGELHHWVTDYDAPGIDPRDDTYHGHMIEHLLSKGEEWPREATGHYINAEGGVVGNFGDAQARALEANGMHPIHTDSWSFSKTTARDIVDWPWVPEFTHGEDYNYNFYEPGSHGKGFVTPDGRLVSWNVNGYDPRPRFAGPHHEEIATHLGLPRYPEISDQAKEEERQESLREGYEPEEYEPSWHTPVLFNEKGEYLLPHQYGGWTGDWEEGKGAQILQQYGYEPMPEEETKFASNHDNIEYVPNTNHKGLIYPNSSIHVWSTGHGASPHHSEKIPRAVDYDSYSPFTIDPTGLIEPIIPQNIDEMGMVADAIPGTHVTDDPYEPGHEYWRFGAAPRVVQDARIPWTPGQYGKALYDPIDDDLKVWGVGGNDDGQPTHTDYIERLHQDTPLNWMIGGYQPYVINTDGKVRYLRTDGRDNPEHLQAIADAIGGEPDQENWYFNDSDWGKFAKKDNGDTWENEGGSILPEKTAAAPKVHMFDDPVSGGAGDEMGMDWRRPLLYDKNANEVYIGAQGDYHHDLLEQLGYDSVKDHDDRINNFIQGWYAPEHPENNRPEVRIWRRGDFHREDAENMERLLLNHLHPEAEHEPQDWRFASWENPQAQTYQRNLQSGPVTQPIMPYDGSTDGKGYIKDGRLVLWSVDSGGFPHHPHVMDEQGRTNVDPDAWVYIDKFGDNDHETTIVPRRGDLETYQQIIEEKGLGRDKSSGDEWAKFANETPYDPYNPNDEERPATWRPGYEAKIIVTNDGQVHTWTDGERHTYYAEDHGIPWESVTGEGWVDKDGHTQGLNPHDAQLAAKALGVEYVAQPSAKFAASHKSHKPRIYPRTPNSPQTPTDTHINPPQPILGYSRGLISSGAFANELASFLDELTDNASPVHISSSPGPRCVQTHDGQVTIDPMATSHRRLMETHNIDPNKVRRVGYIGQDGKPVWFTDNRFAGDHLASCTDRCGHAPGYCEHGVHYGYTIAQLMGQETVRPLNVWDHVETKITHPDIGKSKMGNFSKKESQDLTKGTGSAILGRYEQFSADDQDLQRLQATSISQRLQPGAFGKGLITPQGDIHTWNVGNFGDPHHATYAMNNDIQWDINNPVYCFRINDNGEYRSFNLRPEDHAVVRSLGLTKQEPKKFGSFGIDVVPIETGSTLSEGGAWSGRIPIIYDDAKGAIYYGSPNSDHSFLRARAGIGITGDQYHGWIGYNPEWRGRGQVESHPNFGWYNSPENEGEVNGIIKQHFGIPDPEEAKDMSGWKFAAVRVVRPEPDESYNYNQPTLQGRIPYVYDEKTDTVAVGHPGWHHYGLLDAIGEGRDYSDYNLGFAYLPNAEQVYQGDNSGHNWYSFKGIPTNRVEIEKAINNHLGLDIPHSVGVNDETFR